MIGTDVTGPIALGNAQERRGDRRDRLRSVHRQHDRRDVGDRGQPDHRQRRAGRRCRSLRVDISVGNQITANRIFGNTGQAIDLGDDGVTYNATSPRQGPNNLQNFPIIVTTADGQLEGWLGAAPDTTFRIDVFASAGYGPGGAGEAEDYLGSLEVTTDSQGQVDLRRPLHSAGRPAHHHGHGHRPPGQHLRSLGPAPGDPAGAFAVRSRCARPVADLLGRVGRRHRDPGPRCRAARPGVEPDALGPAGTLTLSSTAGLTGSGDGTGSLSYSGPLSALERGAGRHDLHAAAGSHVFTTLTLDAQSDGAPPLQAQFVDHRRRLRGQHDGRQRPRLAPPGDPRFQHRDRAARITIDFAIPGAGVQTIAPVSPLPAITDPVLIDGTTQPGYAGTPLIAIVSQGRDADP